MTTPAHGFRVALACLLAWGLSRGRAAQKQNLPLPRMVVPKAAAAPTIDGKMAPGEWDRAAACSAFTVAFHGQLARNQSVAWVTYDDACIYVCFQNSRGPFDTLLSKRARETDDEAIVFDHSNEIWITPPGAPQATYQTLFNAYPGVFDVKHIPSVGYTAKAWRGNWQIASSETRDHWIVEAKAPLRSFGFGSIRDGATWRGLFTTDVLGKGGGFRAWAPGGAFAEINRHGFLHFRDSTPVFQLLDVESIFTGKFAFPMAVTAPAKGRSTVGVTLRFGPGVKGAKGDLVLTKKVAVENGSRKTFTLRGDVTGRDLPRKKIVVQPKPRIEKEVPHGFCEVTAKASAGTVLYHQVFPFVVDGSARKPPAKIKKSPYETPFGLKAFPAPLSKKLIVKIDRYYMRNRGLVVAGKARLIDPATKKVVAERNVAPFRQDYSQFAMDLSGLKVPMQTEADWAKAQPLIEANKKRAKQGQPPKPVPGPKPAEYLLEVALRGNIGAELAKTSVPVRLLGYQFEWLGNRIGISDKVIPPWTPLKWNKKTKSLFLWNKKYQLDGLGMASMIVNAGRTQLWKPMRLVMTSAGGGESGVDLVSAPKLVRLTEAYAEFTGEATAGRLRIRGRTRVEFDGFVLNRMTLHATRPVRLARLSLVVRMEKREAPCFVTTAGGWSAVHGWTPDRWDSRETSSGSRVGNFVPYIFLTDSERGFCWFADNDRGWLLDPKEPTQELFCKDGVVYLRINFVTNGTIDRPTTIEYGWMVTPQKPRPHGWRATHITYHRPYPKATTVFYGMGNVDWAVLWPYYSSPYPWDYAKSKKAFDGGRASGVVVCAGNIAHAIARYRDYKGRWFNELAADWGAVLGDRSNGNVTRCRQTNDFQVWHFDRWVKRSGMQGIYFDENYLSEEWNYLKGNAYLLADERIQPGYSYLGLREYNKRLRYMFHANGLAPPNLWLHTTSGQPVYAWMPDVAMEGENVSPTSMENDYISCLPAGRLRSISMGANLGAAAVVMCQADRHWNPAFGRFMCEQFVGWVLAHDCLPESLIFWPILAAEMEMWHDDIRFLPYWKSAWGAKTKTKGVLVSAHRRKGRAGRAVLWIVNTAREDRKATVELNLRRLVLDPAKTIAFDAETSERYPLRRGASEHLRTLTIPVPKRMWRAVRLMQPKLLKDDVTFVAHFNGDEVAADEAFGHRYARTRQPGPAKTVPGGRTGRAAALEEALTFDTRHHVTPEAGSVAFRIRFDKAKPAGTLLAIGQDGLTLRVDRGKLKLLGPKRRTLAEAEVTLAAAPAWHDVSVRWKGRSVAVAFDGKDALTASLDAPLPIRPMGRGLDIQDFRRRIQPSRLLFGPTKGARIDDLIMARE